MRWDLIMLFEDTALPSLDGDNDYWTGGRTVSLTENFGDLARGAYAATVALLEGRVDLHDAEIKHIVSERFEDEAWTAGQSPGQSPSSNGWERTFDAALPAYAGLSASAIQRQLADNPTVVDAMAREWMNAAAIALTSSEDVDSAFQLLQGVRSFRCRLAPGARCFGEFDRNPAVYDCRRYVMGAAERLHEGRLVLVKLEIREGG